jgi:hypothetical protein
LSNTNKCHLFAIAVNLNEGLDTQPFAAIQAWQAGGKAILLKERQEPAFKRRGPTVRGRAVPGLLL